jgi:thiamine pyrophosphokinase
MQRAVIFANGDPNDGPMVRRALNGWHEALVVAADGGARVAAYFGVTVQAVIGDMDSLAPAELEALAARGVHIERHPEEKDETDLELALAWVVARGADHIRVIGGVGDRLDQTLSNVYLLALPLLNGCDARLVAGRQEAWLLGPGEHLVQGAPGDTISLLPLNGTVRGIYTDGLYYPLRDEDLHFGPARGVSNVLAAPRGLIRVREGVLLIVQTEGRA